jgi:hypothetical protein
MITPTETTGISPEPNNHGNSQLLEAYLPLLRSVVYRMRQKLPTWLKRKSFTSIGLSGLTAAVHKYPRDAFKVELPIEAVFTARTVSTLAELIENAEGRSVDDEFEEGSA